jgi:hypothetical protein
MNDVINDVFVNKYDFELAHFNEDIAAGKSMLKVY